MSLLSTSSKYGAYRDNASMQEATGLIVELCSEAATRLLVSNSGDMPGNQRTAQPLRQVKNRAASRNSLSGACSRFQLPATYLLASLIVG